MPISMKSRLLIYFRKFLRSLKTTIINRLFTGLIVIIPLGVTFYVITVYLFSVIEKTNPSYE